MNFSASEQAKINEPWLHILYSFPVWRQNQARPMKQRHITLISAVKTFSSILRLLMLAPDLLFLLILFKAKTNCR